MEYQITTPAGITTVDSLCTIGTLTHRLRGIGVAHIKASDITRPDRSRLSPNQNQSSSAATGR